MRQLEDGSTFRQGWGTGRVRFGKSHSACGAWWHWCVCKPFPPLVLRETPGTPTPSLHPRSSAQCCAGLTGECGIGTGQSRKAFPSYCVPRATRTQGLTGARGLRNWQVIVAKIPEQAGNGEMVRVWAVSQA